MSVMTAALWRGKLPAVEKGQKTEMFSQNAELRVQYFCLWRYKTAKIGGIPGGFSSQKYALGLGRKNSAMKGDETLVNFRKWLLLPSILLALFLIGLLRVISTAASAAATPPLQVYTTQWSLPYPGDSFTETVTVCNEGGTPVTGVTNTIYLLPGISDPGVSYLFTCDEGRPQCTEVDEALGIYSWTEYLGGFTGGQCKEYTFYGTLLISATYGSTQISGGIYLTWDGLGPERPEGDPRMEVVVADAPYTVYLPLVLHNFP